MSLHIDSNSTIRSLRAIRVENEHIIVNILPDVGAKIYDLIWKPTGRNFLWHNPRIQPQPFPVDSNFDNYWCGGWDEGYPTCDTCEHAGEQFPNLGELRSLHWHADQTEVHEGVATVHLFAFGPITPVMAEKTVTLKAGSPTVTVRYQVTNLGPMGLDFIWGTHPALAVSPHTVMHIPARTGIVGQASSPKMGAPGQRYAWPQLDTPEGRIDMSRAMDLEANLSAGHYAADLEAGWYAVEHTDTGEGFFLRFPAGLCPYLWLWLDYGAWRGYQNVIVEPWTSHPVNLAEAVKQKTSRRLEPGEKFVAEVEATLYTTHDGWKELVGATA